MGSWSSMTREMQRMLSGRSMGRHLMGEVASVWNMQMEMIVEVTEIDSEVGIDVDMEIETGIPVDVEDKFLMENSKEPIIAWLWKIFPQELLGRT